jgi:hypothetical protein
VKFDEQSTLFLAEIFKFHEQHVIVCTELEPWEKHTTDCQGKISVAKSKSKLFKGKVGPIFIVHMLAIMFLELLAF